MMQAAKQTELRAVMTRLVEVAQDMGADPVQANMIRINCQSRWPILLEAMTLDLDDSSLALAMLDPDRFVANRAEGRRMRRFRMDTN